MSEAKHTPTPWVAIPMRMRWHGDRPLFPDGLWMILPADDMERTPICTVDHADDHHPPCRTQARYDAEFIVRAVNAHEDLVAALKAIQWGNEFDEGGARYSLCPMCDQSEARGHAPDCRVGMALEKAEGRA